MKTREFLRRYTHVYLYVTAFFLALAGLYLHSVETVGSMQPFDAHPVIIIDPGHGGIDGGTTGLAGSSEQDLNLAIAKRVDAMLRLLGYETVMTRTTADSVATEGETIRQQKQSDLRNRVDLVNGLADAVLVSIHQNHYPDSRYSGPQVFYAGDAQSLAAAMQECLTRSLAPNSRREVKKSSGVYLMEHIQHPGILIECGFLSNAAEEQKLNSPEYQKQLAAVIAAVMANYAGNTVT